MRSMLLWILGVPITLIIIIALITGHLLKILSTPRSNTRPDVPARGVRYFCRLYFYEG